MEMNINLLEKAQQYEKLHTNSAGCRPVFHFSAPVGWLNDPNGLSVFRDEIHLFFQYNPYGKLWGSMHWGHAVTKGMIKWEYLPVALAPDCTFDNRGCFSGSAVTYDGKHYIAYTGVSCGEDGAESQSQCIAAGDGLHYHKESYNPVITAQLLPEKYSSSHFRDPKMWQDEDGLHMIVGCLDQNKEGHLAHFCSTDMKHWHFEGMFLDHIPGLGRMWECPDFFSLQGQDVVIISPQDMAAQPPEIHNGNNSLYILGTFERNKGEFVPYKTYALDYGLDFYAAQTVTLKDQRVILIAWMQSWDS